MIRALSLTQPWASLVAIGAKEWETRSWPTPYRGQVAIHASKGYPRNCRELESEEPFMSALKRGLTNPHALPTGSIIALADLEECLPTEAVLPRIGENEKAFGDYYPGRYAYRLAHVLQLPRPIPCRGALGFWPIPDDVVAQIYMQLREEMAHA